ncbi:hypothetical protein [Kitasatospora sp. NPDC007106]|uniref:DUF6907 domain-containing protein n=1 Tax=Kitasatospora sp. NPDC007106 TaxID=3156914 RepID=UPI0033C116EA
MTHDPTPRRTAAVRLIDGTTVTVREPAWCLGRHDQGEHLVDLTHDGPVTDLPVQTARGLVDLLDVGLTQSPYSSVPAYRETRAAVSIAGACYRYDAAGLFALADAIAGHAVQLRVFARELAVLEGREAGR